MQNSTPRETKPRSLTKIPWAHLAALAVTGHLAWAVENTWFGTFAYDRIRPDMSIVAIMTSVTAVVATLTTIFMGTLSDRSRSKWGKRRPFIFLGYIFWGLMTVLFPLSALVRNTGLAVMLVVLIDSLMTFFGSTANDAAFNAWTAEIAPPSKRGKVEGVLQVCLFVAQIISYTLAGMLIDKFDYFFFFYILGGLVMIVGFLAARKLPEPELDSQDRSKTSFLADLKHLFRWQTVKENPELFKLLLMIMISSIGMQVSLPYLVIYVENYLKFSKTEFGLIGAAIMGGSLLISLPFGLLADKLNRKRMLIIAILMSALGCFMFAQVRSLPLLALAGFIWQAFYVGVAIASVSWLKDLLPENTQGRFLGLRMVFWIMIPMILGPWIAVWAMGNQSVTTLAVQAGQFVPEPIIFIVSAFISALAVVPLIFLKGGNPHLATNEN